MMLKQVGLTAAAALFLGLGLAYAHGSEKHEAKAEGQVGKPVTMTGEVIDLACYMQHSDTGPEPGHGPEHAGCAKQCINKGLPAGLKVDGKLYLLLGEEHASVADLVANLAGQQATIQGRLIDHRVGMSAIVVLKAKRAP